MGNIKILGRIIRLLEKVEYSSLVGVDSLTEAQASCIQREIAQKLCTHRCKTGA